MAKKIQGDLEVKNNLTVDNQLTISQTGNRALVTDASGNVIASSVSDTELEYLSGLSGDVQDQLDSKIDLSEKGAANGVAELGADGKVPDDQLPPFIEEYADFASFPATGETGRLYVALDTGKLYVWSGSAYVETSSSEVSSVNGQTGVVVLDSDDIAEGVTNLYFTDERSQDSVGGILVNSTSVSLTYDDATPEISATVIESGVDHDQLLNHEVNEHVDHSSVEIETVADSGLTGGGDITVTRSLSVDINGTTEELTVENSDEILIYDSSTSSLKKVTRSTLLSGIALSSTGDISETSSAISNNQGTPADVVGFSFSNAIVRSFDAHVSVYVDADSDSFESFRILGIQKSTDWEITIESVGDDSGIIFTITNSGQIQYVSSDYAGFTAATVKFRAITTSI